jgi:hypothetical protein
MTAACAHRRIALAKPLGKIIGRVVAPVICRDCGERMDGHFGAGGTEPDEEGGTTFTMPSLEERVKRAGATMEEFGRALATVAAEEAIKSFEMLERALWPDEDEDES